MAVGNERPNEQKKPHAEDQIPFRLPVPSQPPANFICSRRVERSSARLKNRPLWSCSPPFARDSLSGLVPTAYGSSTAAEWPLSSGAAPPRYAAATTRTVADALRRATGIVTMDNDVPWAAEALGMLRPGTQREALVVAGGPLPPSPPTHARRPPTHRPSPPPHSGLLVAGGCACCDPRGGPRPGCRRY